MNRTKTKWMGYLVSLYNLMFAALGLSDFCTKYDGNPCSSSGDILLNLTKHVNLIVALEKNSRDQQSQSASSSWKNVQTLTSSQPWVAETIILH